MTRADAQQQRLLQRLRQTANRLITFDELRAGGGIDFPATVVGELAGRHSSVDSAVDEEPVERSEERFRAA